MSGVNSKCDQKSIVGANIGAVRPRAQSLPPIFKLNVDCFEDLFEWLSLRDLKMLRRTCKRMKQVVDYFIRLMYPRALQKIRLDVDRLEYFRDNKPVGFELINHITLRVYRLTRSQAEGIKQILGQAESINLLCSFPDCDFYDGFLKYCTRLKHLLIIVGNDRPLIGNGNEWLHRQYPTLEYIGIRGSALIWSELEIFFEKNPNVRTLSIHFDFVWQNCDWILASNIKLGRLNIFHTDSSRHDSRRVYDLLNKLHERGFYQRLYASFNELSNDNEITSLHTVDRMGLHTIDNHVLPSLSSLRELIIQNTLPAEALEVLAENLTNIQRIYTKVATIGTILHFIRHCPKLKQIKIKEFWGENLHRNGIINLLALNNERKRLPNARKTTIFIEEGVFLRNKWKQSVNLGLVELKPDLEWEQSDPFYEQ